MTRREKEAFEQGQQLRQAFNDYLAGLAIGADLLVIFFLS